MILKRLLEVDFYKIVVILTKVLAILKKSPSWKWGEILIMIKILVVVIRLLVIMIKMITGRRSEELMYREELPTEILSTPGSLKRKTRPEENGEGDDEPPKKYTKSDFQEVLTEGWVTAAHRNGEFDQVGVGILSYLILAGN